MLTAGSAAQAATGGALIGLAATLLLSTTGRVAGVSGLFGALLSPAPTADARERRQVGLGFVLGLCSAGFVATRLWPARLVASPAPLAILVAAGLLVGFGTRLGGGCTSGHGVCGISRGSTRSIVATVVFMAFGMVATYMLRRFTGGGELG